MVCRSLLMSLSGVGGTDMILPDPYNDDQKQVYDDGTYSETTPLMRKVYPVHPPTRPMPDPDQYEANRQASLLTSYDSEYPWLDRPQNPTPSAPKPPRLTRRPRERGDGARAYNSQWVDVPFWMAWGMWFVLFGVPSLFVAAIITIGLKNALNGQLVWVGVNMLVSWAVAVISRYNHRRNIHSRYGRGRAGKRRWNGKHEWK